MEEPRRSWGPSGWTGGAPPFSRATCRGALPPPILVRMNLAPLLAVALTSPLPRSLVAPAADLRSAYDVLAYRMDVRVDPATKTFEGTLVVDASVVAETLDVLQLDLHPEMKATGAREIASELTPHGVIPRDAAAGAKLELGRDGRALTAKLAQPRKRGERVRIAIDYSGQPRAQDGFEGVHWKRTKDGKPWMSIACQGVGSSWWWPCKDSFWHPEDKPERTFVNATVPKGLFAVSNGRLASREVNGELETFHWEHEYPCETYSITLDVAPYEVVERELTLEGLDQPLKFIYYVLPENAEKAKLQFEDVPEMLKVYGDAFGPFPFPKSKFALVETSFWGMEHSTAVAYGSSYPKWCEAHGETDRYAAMNRSFDYILVHESAHEWWGNAVSAKDWGHFWLHEGFATYAEAVYLEKTRDRAAADEHLERIRDSIGPRARLYRGEGVDSNAAYDIVLYHKGAWVLNTLRHYVGDDEAWWRALRAFNLEFRYSNATTEDFAAVLERETKTSWKRFFDEWFYGTGYPQLSGSVRAHARGITVDVRNEPSDKTPFHVPLDVSWKAGKESGSRRVWLEPGANSIEIELPSKPRDVAIHGLEHVLGRHDVSIE